MESVPEFAEKYIKKFRQQYPVLLDNILSQDKKLLSNNIVLYHAFNTLGYFLKILLKLVLVSKHLLHQSNKDFLQLTLSDEINECSDIPKFLSNCAKPFFSNKPLLNQNYMLANKKFTAKSKELSNIMKTDLDMPDLRLALLIRSNIENGDMDPFLMDKYTNNMSEIKTKLIEFKKNNQHLISEYIQLDKIQNDALSMITEKFDHVEKYRDKLVSCNLSLFGSTIEEVGGGIGESTLHFFIRGKFLSGLNEILDKFFSSILALAEIKDEELIMTIKKEFVSEIYLNDFFSKTVLFQIVIPHVISDKVFYFCFPTGVPFEDLHYYKNTIEESVFEEDFEIYQIIQDKIDKKYETQYNYYRNTKECNTIQARILSSNHLNKYSDEIKMIPYILSNDDKEIVSYNEKMVNILQKFLKLMNISLNIYNHIKLPETLTTSKLSNIGSYNKVYLFRNNDRKLCQIEGSVNYILKYDNKNICEHSFPLDKFIYHIEKYGSTCPLCNK